MVERLRGARLAAHAWDTMARAGTVAVNPDETVRVAQALVEADVEELPLIAFGVAGGDRATAELIIGEELGAGGMGIVHLAEQRSLRRKVAIKRARPDRGPPANATLLREALVGGRLEHPNVIPIHLLARDESGCPQLVMKLARGRRWAETLAGDRDRETGANKRLEHHIGILLQVCNAVDFAHSQNVVHRDLKPDNVMLGTFGEVYVLDWGIAVDLSSDREEHGSGIVGTPCYMAPEMLEGEARVGPWTDVFLLGATLHEVATGQPLHLGTTLRDVLEAAAAGREPALPPQVPRELATIVARATRAEPEQRYASVAAFREALQQFLEHRSSRRLAQESRTRMDALLPLLRQPRSSALSLYQRFAECRFGFQQALVGWPDNARAREDLQRLLEAMVEFELGRRNPGSAHALLAEMPERPQALVSQAERVQREVDAERDQAARLAKMEHEGDLRVAGRARGIFVAVVGVATAGGALLAKVLEEAGIVRPTHELAILVLGGIEVLMLLGILLLRRRLLSNQANRRFALVGLLAPFAYALVHGMALQHGLSFRATISFDLLAGGIGAVLIGIYQERALLILGIGLCLSGVLIGAVPSLFWELFAAIAIVASVPTSVWWSLQEARRKPAQRARP